MSREGKFLVYCMERYRYYRHLTGKEVSELFKNSGANDYILRCFGALHTVGEEYLINDLDEYIDHTIRAENL